MLGIYKLDHTFAELVNLLFVKLGNGIRGGIGNRAETVESCCVSEGTMGQLLCLRRVNGTVAVPPKGQWDSCCVSEGTIGQLLCLRRDNGTVSVPPMLNGEPWVDKSRPG